MKELKKHYWKAFLALIKTYKRYYLGAWIIKLPFYKLTSNQHKFTKWQAKRDERLEFLHNALQNFKNTKNILKAFDWVESKKWLNSPEFKTKYLDTKHPYPPLLNPNSIDYKSIPAELAWEMNLPLPPNYDLIYFTNGASASLCILNFFKACKLKVIPYWIGKWDLNTGEKYMLDYANLLKNYNSFNIIAIHLEKVCANKYSALLTKSVPLLYVARCPIGRIKSACNHDAGFEITEEMKSLNLLHTNFTNLFPKTKYRGQNGALSDPKIQTGLFEPTLYPKICFDSFLSQMPNLGKKYIFDFESFAPNRCFKIFRQIAKIFNLNMPQDERLFNTRAEKARFGLGVLPVEFSHDKITIHICSDSSVRNNEIVELTETILGKSYYFINDSEIIIYTTKNNARLLESSNDFARIKAYLVDYIKALENNVKATLQSLISEEQILEYLRNDKQKREMLKSVFDNELGFLKANYPDIVASWKYYNEFERMCAKCDKSKER